MRGYSKRFVFFILALTVINFGYSETFKLSDRIRLDTEVFLPGSIVVFKGDIIIADRKGANIKVFNFNGKLSDSVGNLGVGPGDFQQPSTSTMIGNKYMVFDSNIARLSFFNIADHQLKFKKFIIFGKHWISDIKPLQNNRLLVAGYFFVNGNYVCLAEFNLKNRKFEKTLMFTKSWMGVKTKRELEQKQISTYRFLSIDGFSEVDDDNFYFASGSHLKLFKINKKNNKISELSVKSRYFKEPELPLKQLAIASRKRDRRLWLKCTQNRSFVKDLLLIKNKLLVIVFTNYNKEKKTIDIYQQTLDLNGKLVDEGLLFSSKSKYSEYLSFFYDKKSNNYYVLSIHDDESGNINGNVFKFVLSSRNSLKGRHLNK